MTTATPNRRADARENREAILAVALQALTESADVSLNAIAKRAGVANATLYRHFPTREALVLAVYQCDVERMRHAATELLAEHPPLEALRRWMRALAECTMTKRGLADAMRLATGAGRSLFPETYQAMRGAVAELLAAGHEAGTVRPGLDPEIILLALCGIWQLDPDSQEQADALIDLLVTGLSAATTGSASP
ncbi:AcrR family transcriptional regulator [Thermocatellispora tengchongensis]|uniref:AcrR family transcriptional regulator n=1 Tax=Thermocatellispora tengchongensis TaxID=1073253 RepID=A0A840PGA6_9ACTN|nr:TetR/AcrR family transcriptional regulator [Thermocatellispora tengchongensis]MBB5137836.1 AcrR family transcriptional regulator [Thermocatellispora tengchongensis]